MDSTYLKGYSLQLRISCRIQLKNFTCINFANIRRVPSFVMFQKSTPCLKDYLKSIIYIPYSLKILCLTNLFCWMAHSSYSLYFTDFVGEAVFEGDPSVSINSQWVNARVEYSYVCRVFHINRISFIPHVRQLLCYWHIYDSSMILLAEEVEMWNFEKYLFTLIGDD